MKNLTCIECPNGCRLTIEEDESGQLKVSGNQCEKGEKYSLAEMTNPMRVVTSTVLAKGLSVKMIPVRTDQPIPKSMVFDAMKEIKRIRVTQAVEVGTSICENFLNCGVKLIATRTVE